LGSAGGFPLVIVGVSGLLLSGCWGGPSIGPRIGSEGRHDDDTITVHKAALPQAHADMAGSGAELDAPDAGMGDAASAPVDHPQPQEPRPVSSDTADDDVRCGNGVLDDNELCDISIPDGDKGACPTVCSSDACHPEALEIRGCMSRCMPIEPGADCEANDT
jgi:hypothetical protein